MVQGHQKKLLHAFTYLLKDKGFLAQIKALQKHFNFPVVENSDEYKDFVTNQKIYRSFVDELKSIRNTYNLPPDMNTVLFCYTAFGWNITKKKGVNNGLYTTSFKVVDAHRELGVEREQPIALLITPYSSKEDLKNFIQNCYEMKIKPLQEIYKNKTSFVGKVRHQNKLVQKKKELVLKLNKKVVSALEIANKVEEKYGGSMSAAHVRTVISQEKRKNKS
jgi:hypothetical protein